jgi:hypothetical protein
MLYSGHFSFDELTTSDQEQEYKEAVPFMQFSE